MHRKILLIQSDVESAATTRRALAGVGCGVGEIVWAKTLSEGVERLDPGGCGADPSISAIVCDLSLPDSSGLETFKQLFARCRSIPIFILCDRHLRSAAQSALRIGAQRYFLKGLTEDCVLADSVGRAIERSEHESTLYEERDRAQITLEAIADGVVSTDENGLVTYCNPVAAKLAGWSQNDARGRSFVEVFRLTDAKTLALVPDPMARAMRENAAVSLTPDCLLVRRDGMETAIEDSAAPIHDKTGKAVGAVIVFRDVSSTRAAALKMSYLAQHDALTDLPNRLLFSDRLRQAVEVAKRHGQMLAVLFLDLDHFKNINDSLGHAVGDQLLQSIGHRLTTCVRSTDTVSRQGGDEFVILLSEITHVEDATTAAEKILKAVALPGAIEDHELHITASIGVVVYPRDGSDDATLLKNADAAMYHAKDNGRNNYQFFNQEMHVLAVERQQLESEMRQALKLGQFVLHYQPIVELEHFTVAGVEALVRWQHPLRGLLHPKSFMAVAEQCGFVIPMGRWVIHEACRQAQAWAGPGFPTMRIAVNTSALELRTKGFVDGVRESLQVTGFAPDHLEMEITETALLQDSRNTAEVLSAIADMGVHLALDDFGTGYSSLSHLKRYPITTLKIDRSFISELATDVSDAEIVNAVIGLGNNLGLRVVAEGVETLRQALLLRSHGCGEAQGYYFGRPVEASGLAGLLDNRMGLADEQVVHQLRNARRFL